MSGFIQSGRFGSGAAYDLQATFTNADTVAGTMPNADTGQAFSMIYGTSSAGTGWRILSNAAIDTTTENEAYLIANSGISDGTFTGRVTTLPTSGDGGLVIRCSTNAQNCFLLNIEPTRYALYVRSGGGYAQIDTVARTPVVGDVMQIVASGTSLTASVNGVFAAGVTNANHTTNTLVGFRSSNAGGSKTVAYDDLTAT